MAAVVKLLPEVAVLVLVEQAEQWLAYLPHYCLYREYPDPPRWAEASC